MNQDKLVAIEISDIYLNTENLSELEIQNVKPNQI